MTEIKRILKFVLILLGFYLIGLVVGYFTAEILPWVRIVIGFAIGSIIFQVGAWLAREK